MACCDFRGARHLTEDGWEVTNRRGDGPGNAQWSGTEGRDDGMVLLRDGELRSPLIPVAIRKVPSPSGERDFLEPGIYRATVRARAHGTPERGHCPYARKGPHSGVVHMRFYDKGGRTAPGSWFSRAIVGEDWQDIEFVAMAPQWTRRARIAVIAHSGCTIEVDTLENHEAHLYYALDTHSAQ